MGRAFSAQERFAFHSATSRQFGVEVELKRWSLEHVVEMTGDFMRRKEDAKFEAAFVAL
jgi:hypothetical protein